MISILCFLKIYIVKTNISNYFNLTGCIKDDKGEHGQKVWQQLACDSGRRVRIWNYLRDKESAVHVFRWECCDRGVEMFLMLSSSCSSAILVWKFLNVISIMTVILWRCNACSVGRYVTCWFLFSYTNSRWTATL